MQPVECFMTDIYKFLSDILFLNKKISEEGLLFTGKFV